MENRNIDFEHQNAQWPEVGINNKFISDNTRSTWTQQGADYGDYLSPRLFSRQGLLALVVLVCICSLILFLAVFMLLQARSNERLCWGHKYQPIPAFYQNNGNERVLLSREDYMDEDEVFSA